MRAFAPLGLVVVHAVGGGLMLGAVPSMASAQSREAAIRVQATVRGITDVDMIGAHALADGAAPARTSGVAASGAWRITSGRSSSVGIQVEDAGMPAGNPGQAITICDTAEGREEVCEPYVAPRLEARTDGALPDFVVRVGRSAPPRDRVESRVRLTVAFIDF
jgi:hypothetical protein